MRSCTNTGGGGAGGGGGTFGAIMKAASASGHQKHEKMNQCKKYNMKNGACLVSNKNTRNSSWYELSEALGTQYELPHQLME